MGKNKDQMNLKSNLDKMIISSEVLIEKICITESKDLARYEDLSDEKIIVTKVLEMFLVNIKPTTLREAASIQDDVALNEKTMVVIVIDYLVETAKVYGWALARYEDTFYLYTGTHWQKIDPDDLKSFLGRAAVKIGVPYFAAKHYKFREDLQKQFYSAGYFSAPAIDENETRVNLNNGTFIFSNSKLSRSLSRALSSISFCLSRICFSTCNSSSSSFSFNSEACFNKATSFSFKVLFSDFRFSFS